MKRGPHKTDWTIETEAGRGLVRHHASPRFTAFWTSGEADPARIEGTGWTSPGSGSEDAIHLFGITWIDPAPEPAGLATLMEQAVIAIDDWIADRL